jgi:hypothetical protein
VIIGYTEHLNVFWNFLESPWAITYFVCICNLQVNEDYVMELWTIQFSLSCLVFLKVLNCLEQSSIWLGFWYGGILFGFWHGRIKDLQVNKWTHDNVLTTNHVYDYVKNASSMALLLILGLLCTPVDIRVHNIYVDTIAYPFHILQLYITSHRPYFKNVLIPFSIWYQKYGKPYTWVPIWYHKVVIPPQQHRSQHPPK